LFRKVALTDLPEPWEITFLWSSNVMSSKQTLLAQKPSWYIPAVLTTPPSQQPSSRA